jgi:type I restriction enzyme S subunit
MGLKAGYKQTEVGVIPEEWESTSVLGIASSSRNAIVGGPFGSDLVSNDYVDDGVPVIRGQNMGNRWVSGSFAFVSPTKAASLEANLAHPGDIVITQRGTLGQVSLVPDAPYPRYLISQSQMKLSVNREMADPLFFYYLFTGEQQQEYIRQNTIQTGVPHTNLGILRKIPVPRPPLPEQRAIAEALSDVDALIGALDRLIAKKRDLKQAAMQQLLTGQKRLPGFSGEWEVKRLRQLAKIQRGASPRPIDSPIWFDDSSTVGWVRISDVTRAGMYLRETEQRLSLLGVQTSRPVRRGSLIMSICATVGWPIITEIDTCIHDGFVVFDHLRADQRFLYYILKSIEPNWSRHGQTGSQMNLNTGLITGTEVSIPPTVAEQTAIAEVLSDMDTEIAALERRRDKTRALKQGMMQELLTGRTRLVDSPRSYGQERL